MYSDTKAKLVAENRELRAEVERLRGVVNDLGEMLGDVRKQRDAATARAEASEKEALEYIDYRNQAVISRNAMERRLEADEALVAGLRGALEEVNEALCAITALGNMANQVAVAYTAINAALALTPASAGALEEARKDNKELDGTDAAHPAWWRGNDAGVSQVCEKINAILDGADVFGTASEPWESTRRRVAEARKDSDRLEWCIKHGAIPVAHWRGWWRLVTHDDVWITEFYETPRAAIDAARGAK